MENDFNIFIVIILLLIVERGTTVEEEQETELETRMQCIGTEYSTP